ncbi:uncharacterized protein isoform X2 [Choristoneura fumiferana]
MTDLEAVRQQYQEHQQLCAETLSNCLSERGRVRQELAEARQRREEKMNALEAFGRNGEAAVQALLSAKIDLAHLKSRFMRLQENLHFETNWQPSVVRTDEEIQALAAKVEWLRSEKRRLRLDGGGLPTANS